MEPGRETLSSIQVLRAVAALGVVLHHLFIELADWSGAAALRSVDIGAAGVDLFFVISGFIMVHSSRDLFGQAGGSREFISRRVIRIVPLYWAVSSVLLAHALLRRGDLASGDLSTGSIVASFLFVPWPRPSGDIGPLLNVGWTLNYEMFFYVVFALCIPLPRRLALAVSGAALCAVVVLGPWLPKPFDFWSNQIVLNFVFGLVIGSAYSEGVRISRATGAFLCALGLAGIAASSWLGDLGSIRILHWSIPAALIVTGCALSPLGSGRHWAILKLAAIGDASYALYLIHPFMSVPRLIVQKLVDPSFAPWLWWPTAYAALLIAGCVVAALIVHRLFEAPVTRYLKRWLATRTAKLPVAAV